MDIHVDVISKSNKTYPYFSTIYILVLYQIKQTISYFTNDNDIHFSAISNQTNTSNSQPDTHCSAVSLSQDSV